MKQIMFLAVLMTITGCSQAGSETISKEEYGADWPFPKFDSGILSCMNKKYSGVKRPLVTIRLDGIYYGLNGAAHGVGGYPDARDQMGKSEWGTYELGATSKIIERGMSQCA
ncbi:MAG: hypothetical protein HKO02_14810 [Hyphomonadaceae bacterium]|nr:hypothetical protein [Hyphomonadaceae bacterium]